MIVHRGHLYAIADAGILYCWKADTGEEKWKGRLGGTFSSLALADGKLYAANEAGEFFVAEASSKQFRFFPRTNWGTRSLPPRHLRKTTLPADGSPLGIRAARVPLLHRKKIGGRQPFSMARWIKKKFVTRKCFL